MDPVNSPSAPATPSAPAAPAVASTPAAPSVPAAPATPSAPSSEANTAEAPDLKPGQTPQDYLREALSKVELPKEEEAKATETTVDTPEKKEGDPAATNDGTKTAEEIAAEALAAENKKQEEQSKKDEQPKQPNPLDKIGPLPAENLAKILTEKPELEKALQDAGISKEVLERTCRDAALTEQFVQEVGTLEGARMMRQDSENFAKIEERFPAMRTVKDFDSFMMDVMIPLSMVYGPDGQPKKRADGSFETDGSVSRFFDLANQFSISQDLKSAEKYLELNPNDEDALDVHAAATVLNQFHKNGYRFGVKPEAELPPELKAREAKLRQDEERNAQRDRDAQAADRKRFDDRVETATFEKLNNLIRETLEPTGLTKKLKEKASNDIYVGIAERLKNNVAYKRMVRLASTKGMDDASFNNLVALHDREIKAIYERVAQQVLNEYGAHQVRKNEERLDKIATQIENDRMNPGTGMGTSKPAAGKLNSEQIHEQARADVLKANNGRQPADFSSQLLKRILELEAQAKGLQVA